MEIRAEKPEDVLAVRQVNVTAFGRDDEANLVDKLREVPSALSFVAIKDNKIVGHICLSPVSIVGCNKDISILGLAPLAVMPEYQRQGIGSALVKYSLQECDRIGCCAIVVLGHPEYYPRFGFVTAKERGLQCVYTVPDEAFMVLELQQGALIGCTGTIKYGDEFLSL